MNDMLLIKYDPFSLDSTVYILRDGVQQLTTIRSNASTFASNIAAIADETNIFSVKIDAPPSVVEEIKQQLTTTNYTKQKLEVEGI